MRFTFICFCMWFSWLAPPTPAIVVNVSPNPHICAAEYVYEESIEIIHRIFVDAISTKCLFVATRISCHLYTPYFIAWIKINLNFPSKAFLLLLFVLFRFLSCCQTFTCSANTNYIPNERTNEAPLYVYAFRSYLFRFNRRRLLREAMNWTEQRFSFITWLY